MRTNRIKPVAMLRELACFATTCVCVGGALQAQVVLQAFPLASMDFFYPVGDVDADGIRDVAIWRLATNVVDVYSLRTGGLHSQLVPAVPYSMFYLFSSAGDVDGDGHDDLIYSAIETTGTYYALITSGRTGAILYVSPGTPGGFNTEGLGDINGDGRSEFLLGDPVADIGTVWSAGRVDLIDGATGQVIRSHVGTYAGQNLGAVFGAGDLDGDDVNDYVVRTWGQLWGYSGRTGQQLFYLSSPSPSFGESVKKVGDFNADGYDDFAVYDRGSYPYVTYEQAFVFGGPSATQLWNRITWIQNPGPVVFGTPAGWIGDLDGDGHDELASRGGAVVSGRSGSFVDGTWWRGLLESPGDVNLDGVPDLLSYGYWQPGVRELRLLSGMPPGAASIGTPCPDAMGTDPVIGIGTGARLGRTMTVNLSKANPNLMLAVLGMGFSDQVWNSVPLPLDLTSYGMPGCHWYIAADAALWMPTAGANGTRHHAQHPIPVPQANSLLGTDLFFQWLVLDQNPATFGSVTRAMRATIVP